MLRLPGWLQLGLRWARWLPLGGGGLRSAIYRNLPQFCRNFSVMPLVKNFNFPLRKNLSLPLLSLGTLYVSVFSSVLHVVCVAGRPRGVSCSRTVVPHSDRPACTHMSRRRGGQGTIQAWCRGSSHLLLHAHRTIDEAELRGAGMLLAECMSCCRQWLPPGPPPPPPFHYQKADPVLVVVPELHIVNTSAD